jgi:hypothetical protein
MAIEVVRLHRLCDAPLGSSSCGERAAKERVSGGECALLQEEDREIIPDLMGARLSGSVGTNDGFGLDPHGAAGTRSHCDGGVFEEAWMRNE